LRLGIVDLAGLKGSEEMMLNSTINPTKPENGMAVRRTQVKSDIDVSFLWLELTGRCGLACGHCYAGSSPSGDHGVMTGADWRSVITQAADMGVAMVQLIGGEPTLHPQFADLLSYVVEAGLAVEVYTNLTHVRDSWWDLFACPQVSLATSYYSDDPGQHDAITGRRGSHAKTRANIAEAIRRGIRLRAGIITVWDGQQAAQARADLEALGVTRIGSDRLRQLGRAADAGRPDVSELCGNCGHGIAAVLPSGDVTPCVMARWLTAGNVRETPLADILAGQAMAAAVAAIPPRPRGACSPDCSPASDSDICEPPTMTAATAVSSRRSARACEPDLCAPDSDSDICEPPMSSALARPGRYLA
jgi:MoaA/NifB/PqqE/SkfB family radical SAM enzyme